MDEAGGAQQRLFVAVPLPDDLLGFVREAQGLLPRLAGLRLMTSEQLHVTLAFIGEVGEAKAGAARAVVESLPTCMGGEGFIERFLFLPSAKRSRVVALDMSDRDGAFARLFETVMAGLEREGVMEREKRPFRPHLTVARLRDPGQVQPTSESGRARYAIESVCLYKSELKREGAAYTVLARTQLANGAADKRA
jgi:2'-5' RNA ligase